MSQDSPEILQLWIALSNARNRREVIEKEGRIDPWESNDSRVKVAWEALTDPKNLAGLRQWRSEPEKINPYARQVAAKAIEYCRAKAAIVA